MLLKTVAQRATKLIMEKANKIPLSLAIIIAAALVAVAIIFVNFRNNNVNGKILSQEQVSSRVLVYINNVLLAGRATAKLESISEERGLYKIKISVGDGQIIESYATKNGEMFFPQGIVLEEKKETVKEIGKTIGDFLVSDSSVCLENAKPIVYFFGSEACVHCKWEEPIIQEVLDKFKDQIVFHKNIDTENDRDVFLRYNQSGTIPTIVAGCKFYRIGSGENVGRDEEIKNLTAIFCKLTNSEPGSVCDTVKDKIAEIKY